MTEAERIYWRKVGVGSVIIAQDKLPSSHTEWEALGAFLVDWAVGMAKYQCDDPRGWCEVCELSTEEWWSSYAELPRYVQMSVHSALIRTRTSTPTDPANTVVE